MYGYVRPDKGELKVKEYELFRAVYCGLCETLRERYGFFTRFAVNYDMTFLAMVLLSDQAQARQRRCPVHPMRKRSVVYDSEYLESLPDEVFFSKRFRLSAEDEDTIKICP